MYCASAWSLCVVSTDKPTEVKLGIYISSFHSISEQTMVCRLSTVSKHGLAVACLTAAREVLGSNRALGSCVYRKTTVIYSLGHGLFAPFLQCLGQLSLLTSVGW